MWQRNELTASHRGDPPTRLGCLRSRQREVRRLITSRFGERRFRLTNVIPEWIIFVSRGTTVLNFRRWHRYIAPKHRWWNIVLRCVKPQRSSDLIHIAAEASNPPNYILFTAHQQHRLHECSVLTQNFAKNFKPKNNFQNHFLRFLSVERHTRWRARRKAWFTLIIVIANHLPATMGLPRCAKLSVCKHSSAYTDSSYAASDARNFKESLKNLNVTIFKGRRTFPCVH